MFFRIVLLLCFPNIFKSEYIPSPEVSVYELLYGDLTNMERFFMLRNITNMTKAVPEKEDKEKKRTVISELLAQLEKGNEPYTLGGPEAQDMNAIREVVKNLTTRRQRSTYVSKWEWNEYWYDLDDWYDYTRVITPTEGRKKKMLVMINLQFLIHARRRIKEAMQRRTVVKTDKRYRLGYLFCRLRKLATTQRKLTTAFEGNRYNTYELHNLYTLIRLYERCQRIDVDMRDTINLIKKTYAERDVIDKMY